MDDINELRAQARKLHRAVGQKVSRIRRTSGVELTGTEYDVRRNPSNIKRYNRAQLESYINTMRNFQSRSNNFLPGSQGAPIPKQLWAEFKRVERAHNARINKERERIENVKTPSGMTTGQQREMHTASRNKLHIGSKPTKSPFVISERSHKNMLGAKGVQKLIKNLSMKSTEKYIKDTMKRVRRDVIKGFSHNGVTTEAKRVRKLTDYQFNQLFQQKKFLDAMRWASGLGRAKAENLKDLQVSESVSNQQNDLVSTYLDWAESLQEPTNDRKDKQAKRHRR